MPSRRIVPPVRVRRLLVGTLVVALCATALIAIGVLLTRSFDYVSVRILLTTTTVSVCALLAVPAGALLDRSPASAIARGSALLTAVAFVLTLAVIWIHHVSATTWKAWGIVGTLALAAAQVCAVESRRRASDTPTITSLVRASAVTGALVAALGVAAILEEISSAGFYRVLGAIAIVDALLVALTAVLRRGAGSAATTYGIRIDGRLVESRGRDFAAAVAAAVRETERSGEQVRRIERV